jgi:hypothetical protein
VDGPSDTNSGISQRWVRSLALWLALAIGFFAAFWIMLLGISPHVRWDGLSRVLWLAARYYLPVFVVAMVPPAMLHLFAPRRLALWSKLFLLLSIALPAIYFMAIRANYLRETARGIHVEGVGLWNAFIYVGLVGLYASLVSFVFAVLLSAREMRSAGRVARVARVHLGASAAVVILYLALFALNFAPFFAVLYR